METLKRCKDCGRELPIEMFKKTRYGDTVSVCTECATKKMRDNKGELTFLQKIDITNL